VGIGDLDCRSLGRPDALKLTPHVARSLSRFSGATAFDQPIGNWITSRVTDMDYMWVLRL
jgi:surface protein